MDDLLLLYLQVHQHTLEAGASVISHSNYAPYNCNKCSSLEQFLMCLSINTFFSNFILEFVVSKIGCAVLGHTCKAHRCQIAICLTFTYYKKAFNSMETMTVIDTLNRFGICPKYIDLSVLLNSGCTSAINRIKVRRAERQCDSISPKFMRDRINALSTHFMTLMCQTKFTHIPTLCNALWDVNALSVQRVAMLPK